MRKVSQVPMPTTPIQQAASLEINVQSLPQDSKDTEIKRVEPSNRCSLESAERFVRQGMDDAYG